MQKLTAGAKYKGDITLDAFGMEMVLVEYKMKESRSITGPASRIPLGYWQFGNIGLIPVQDYKRIRILFNLIHDASILSEFGLESNAPATAIKAPKLEVPALVDPQTNEGEVMDVTENIVYAEEEKEETQEEMVLVEIPHAEETIIKPTKVSKKKTANG